MNAHLVVLLAGTLALAACSKGDRHAGGPQTEQGRVPAEVTADPVQMAYGYSYRFGVPADAIGTVQDRHVAMCEALGLPRCRVLEVHRATGEYGGGSLKLELASDIGRSFGAGLARPVEASGGSLVSSDVQAEDIGRQIVDVEARMRAKQALVARLEQALRTRTGTVAELVATEKAVADAQGELDAVRSELKQAQGRISTSPIEVTYERRTSFGADVGEAFGAAGSTLSTSVVALIYVTVAAVPWLVFGGLVFAGLRSLRRRRRRVKVASHVDPAADSAGNDPESA